MDDDDGWGRSRPRFEEIFYSRDYTLEPSLDEGNVTSNEDMEVEFSKQTWTVDIPRDQVIAGTEGVPKAEINQYYINNKGFSSQQMSSAFTSWMTLIPGESQPKHTSIFTCPIRGEHFGSGYWKNDRGVWNDGPVNFFQSKKDAMNAAAARALDCFSLRKCQGTNRRPSKRCLDDAYLRGKAPPLPAIPNNITLPDVQPRNHPTQSIIAPKTPAKGAVNEWCMKIGRRLEGIGAIPRFSGERQAGKEYFSCWTGPSNGSFTAVFTCPWTGERFASGKMVGCEDKFTQIDCIFALTPSADGNGSTARAWPTDCEDKIPEWVNKFRMNFVHYKTKKEAEIAAAGRAMDCILHRENVDKVGLNEGNIIERYCLEEPYTLDEAPEPWKSISESVNEIVDVREHAKRECEILVKWKEVALSNRVPNPNINDSDDEEIERAAYMEMRRKKIHSTQ
mmetsp:Transcript_14861/g.31174  ORF Transcript_14861/g.31174 Transcript_14861/m.31174 type:complete len:449 (-) Transcript_14861:1860-3206(-)